MAEPVEIALSKSEFKVEVGGTATATATVYNRGSVVDQYKLGVEGLDPAWWDVVPATVSLFPGDEAIVTLNLHPPAEALAGVHAVQLRAVSTDDPGRSAAAEATLHIAPAGGLHLSLQPAVVAGRAGRYQARLTNRANVELRLTLAGRDREEALEYRFDPAALAVPPFGESEASLLVRPRARRLWGRPQSYPFTVQALPEAEEEAAAEADGELQYKPMIGPLALPAGRWRWLLALIPLLALAMLVRSLLQAPPAAPTPGTTATVPPTAVAKTTAGGAAQGPPPTINSFEVQRGEPGFALAWSVADADKVELDGKSVGADGKQPIEVTKDQGFELKASNAGGTVAKRINVLVFPPPVVKSFTANPSEVAPGQPTTLRWEVEGAERAKIGDERVAVPHGELQVKPEASRDYVLIAENGVGWVVQRVPVVVGASPKSAKVETFSYDFETGTADWSLDPAFWSHAEVGGGRALRGAGHGFARLAAHSGDVSSLRFRFQLEDSSSELHASVLESFAGGHTRYFVAFGPAGAVIARQQGSSFKELGGKSTTISSKVFHEAKIMVGGGSIDLFLDGKATLGVDDAATLPPGTVSFESLEQSVAFIDDVEVQIGPEPAPHSRAPRP